MPRIHGKISTTEYSSWSHMKNRCTNINNDSWDYYGGRGITICERWLSFQNFYADMGDKPTPKHTVDRVDNSLGYFPKNCRWATRTDQARNRRKSKNNKSGVIGVKQYGEKWRAKIFVKGKHIHLYFGNDFDKACKARKSAELKYWTE